MKSATRKLLKTVARSLGFNSLFWHLQRLLTDSDPTDSLKVAGVFADSYGNQIELLAGLRDRLKPGWQCMFRPDKTCVPTSPSSSLARVRAWRDQVNHVEGCLKACSFSLTEKEVLEIGTYDGATAYALAEAGAKSVLATDVAAYYITQSPDGLVTEVAVTAKNADLARLRDACGRSVDRQFARRVSFREDDICSSSLQSESVDVVMSWEVLEHLTRPADAFRHIARVLRCGGFAFHEYNPFFSLTGGHSLCTLDFLWGHARLDSADFERYLEETRPREKSVALSFYQNNLNRMTFSELRRYVQQSGLTLLGVLPWCSKDDLALVRSDSLGQCQRVYPSAELIDLISPSVWVLLRKDG